MVVRDIITSVMPPNERPGTRYASANMCETRRSVFLLQEDASVSEDATESAFECFPQTRKSEPRWNDRQSDLRREFG